MRKDYDYNIYNDYDIYDEHDIFDGRDFKSFRRPHIGFLGGFFVKVLMFLLGFFGMLLLRTVFGF